MRDNYKSQQQVTKYWMQLSSLQARCDTIQSSQKEVDYRRLYHGLRANLDQILEEMQEDIVEIKQPRTFWHRILSSLRRNYE